MRDIGRIAPSGHPANSFQIRHDIVGGMLLNRSSHGGRKRKILADLNGHFEFACQRRSSKIVVMADGFFEPVNIFSIERTTAYKRILEHERLIIVDHQGNIVADALSYRVNGRDISLYRRISQPKLDRAKASGEQFLRFI